MNKTQNIEAKLGIRLQIVRQYQTMYIMRLLLLHFSSATNIHPLWTWECKSEKCVPYKVTDDDKRPQSLETCNMLCASVALWPLPTGVVSLSTTAVPLRVDLIQIEIEISPSQHVRDNILEAFEFFLENLRKQELPITNAFQDWRSLFVHFSVQDDTDPRMLLTTDESYKLSLRPNKGHGGPLLVDIIAKSFCGARHGLETLSQLIWYDPYENTLFILEAAKVEDAPKFQYRGLMLDTARNYFPVADLLRTIDGMAASKMNTFHWHATDSQAFSLGLKSVPELAQYGAYGSGAIYTPEDIKTVVHHARVRGIRILLEVDVPAHIGWAWTWGASENLGDLAHCVTEQPWRAYCSDPPCGQLNPRNPNVYDILERIYAEIINLTGVSDVFHLGGDDVSERCWAEQYHDTSPKNLWFEFTNKALEHLECTIGQLPNLTLLWTSDTSGYIKEDLNRYIHAIGLQTRNVAWAHKFVSGIRTVLSHEDVWDLNSGMGAWYEVTSGAPYNSWQRMYEYRPWMRNNEWIVLGGEVTAWSTSLSVSGLDGRVWPRTAAMAERLWSDRPEGASRAVHARLAVHRARLLARGIEAAPLWSMWCTHNTYTCV